MANTCFISPAGTHPCEIVTPVRTPPPTNRCGRGWRDPGSAHGSHSLGSTPNVADLTAGDVTARIKYTPAVTPEAVSHPAFQATFHFGKPGGKTRVNRRRQTRGRQTKGRESPRFLFPKLFAFHM